MIKYSQYWASFGMKVPELHRVYYTANIESYVMRQWLRENCVNHYYTAPDWAGKFVDFVDTDDAVLFTLRWV